MPSRLMRPNRAARRAARGRSPARVALGTAVASALLATPALAATPLAPPKSAPAAQEADPRVVTVKFKDGTDVRAAGDRLQFGSATLQQRIDRILGRAITEQTKPVFDQAPGRLDATRKSLGARGHKLADLTAFVDVELERSDDARAVLAKLKADPQVESATIRQPSQPAGIIEDLRAQQSLIFAPQAATTPGIGVAPASSVPGALGGNVDVVVLEYSMKPDHEDLPNNIVVDGVMSSDTAHGTMTAGVIAAQRNGIGIDGIAPDVQLRFFAASEGGEAARIIDAADVLEAGDVIEMAIQTGDLENKEVEPDFYAAVKYAVAKGIHVVEAAGNSTHDLDAPHWQHVYAPANDSGAIIVGAGYPPNCYGRTPRTRIFLQSNFGQRVNVQAPGWCVPATTREAPWAPNGWYDWYTGTSSASAITAGVVAGLSSAYTEATGAPLDPLAARAALVKTGTPQSIEEPKPTGPQVNLKGAIDEVLATPNTTISSGPTGAASQPTFAFSTDATAVTGFDCRIVPIEGTAPAFAPCSAEDSHQPAAALADGQYRFEVRARKGPNGPVDQTPATKTFWSVASGGAVRVASNQVSVTALAGVANEISIRQGHTTYVVEDTAQLKAGTGCLQLTLNAVQCVGSAITGVSVAAGDRDDRVEVDIQKPSFISGGAGNDHLQATGPQLDIIVGGAGADTVSYETVDVPVSVTLDGLMDDGPVGGVSDYIGADIESVIGGSAADTLSGGAAFGWLSGGPGNDVITAGAGGSIFDGGLGDDTLIGGAGNDTLDYSQRADALWINLQAAVVFGDDAAHGVDTLAGTFEEVVGGQGGNTFIDVAGSQRLFGGAGDDQFWLFGGGDDQAFGGNGNDTFIDGLGNDQYYGQGGDDHISLYATSGSDVVIGGANTDTVSYAAFSPGVSVSNDGVKNDGVPGVTGQLDNVMSDVEVIEGGNGNDTLSAGPNATTLYGYGGNDTLTGGAGADVLIGGAGIDTLRGGAGNDQLKAKDAVPGEQLTCGAGSDQVERDSGDVLVDGVACETVTS